jgi:protein-tyrosine phosphatase
MLRKAARVVKKTAGTGKKKSARRVPTDRKALLSSFLRNGAARGKPWHWIAAISAHGSVGKLKASRLALDAIGAFLAALGLLLVHCVCGASKSGQYYRKPGKDADHAACSNGGR